MTALNPARRGAIAILAQASQSPTGADFNELGASVEQAVRTYIRRNSTTADCSGPIRVIASGAYNAILTGASGHDGRVDSGHFFSTRFPKSFAEMENRFTEELLQREIAHLNRGQKFEYITKQHIAPLAQAIHTTVKAFVAERTPQRGETPGR